MRNLQWIATVLIIFLSIYASKGAYAFQSPDLFDHILQDYQHYYSGRNLVNFTSWIATGAVIANSGIDKDFQSHWQQKLRHHDQDQFLNVFQSFGENAFAHLPLFLIALSIGDASQNNFLGSLSRWGDVGIRIWALSGPQQLFLTNIFGGERPGPGSRSHWKPFHGYRGVSGHAFFGAVPWLAASEATQNRVLKRVFLGASVLPALSRVNNNFHYISQAWLGWGFAYLALHAIAKEDHIQNIDHDWIFTPIPLEDGVMLGVRVYF